jgi:hypothetical protein
MPPRIQANNPATAGGTPEEHGLYWAKDLDSLAIHSNFADTDQRPGRSLMESGHHVEKSLP